MTFLVSLGVNNLMKREIVINAAFGETRAAVMEDKRLVELYLERDANQRVVGNIYKGRVENVLPGMQAAFVNIGLERNAFLYVDDARAYRNGEDEPFEKLKVQSIMDVVKEGQSIIVQITKEPLGQKGARVVTNIGIPGRYLVWMPNVEYIGISRRITQDKERVRLRNIAKRIKPPGQGVIIRTEAEGKDEEELKNDAQFLQRIWEGILKTASTSEAPSLLYKDYDLVYRLARDRLTSEVDKLVVDSEKEYRKLLETFNYLGPHLKNRIFLYHEGPPIFDAYGVEKQIDQALQRKVWLECGGYLVIDHTEALTSIDVNTGRFIGTTDLSDTVLQTNLQAAVEIARQLRLRDIGGIIIVDFIDMETKEDEKKVLQVLEEEIGKDKTKTHILGFTQLGLVEITRKKVKQDIEDLYHKVCPHCQGSGQILSETTVAYRTQRELISKAKSFNGQAMLIACHPFVAAVLIGSNGANLKRLEEHTGKILFIKGTEGYSLEEVRYLAMGTMEEVQRKALPVQEGQVLNIQVEEPHASNPRDGIARLEGYVLDIEGAGRHVGEKLQIEITRVYKTYAKGKMMV
jgi:ribonuclease G